MLSFDEISQQLNEAIDDGRLTAEEKYQLQALVKNLDSEKLSYLRNQAFTISRQQLIIANGEADILSIMRWLERVIKIIDATKLKANVFSSVHFSPGEECRTKLVELCRRAKKTVDICVYTISDDRLSNAIIDAHKRGVQVRVITDNLKSEDLGSDIEYLIEKNIPLVMDVSTYHMHHKFAVFDGEWLANGSFNWTRSASEKNEENIVVINDSRLVKKFSEKFNTLWAEYSR